MQKLIRSSETVAIAPPPALALIDRNFDYANVVLVKAGGMHTPRRASMMFAYVLEGAALVADRSKPKTLAEREIYGHWQRPLPMTRPIGSGSRLMVISAGWRTKDDLPSILTGGSPGIQLRQGEEQSVSNIALALLELADASSDGAQRARAKLASALAVLAIGTARQRFSATDPIHAAIDRAVVTFHAMPARHWTLRELSAELGVSRTVFAEEFRAQIGTPPAAYLRNLRLRLAARLIRDEGWSVKSAALNVGFLSVPSFSLAFKREFGVSPGAL